MTVRSETGPKPSGETLRFMQRLWNLSHALDVRSKRMVATLGVTGAQRLVIRMVGQMPGSSASEIAATLNLHPSTLTGIFARLEERELIRRVMDPSDRRRSQFELTSSGRDVDRERRGTVEAAVRRALGRSNPHQIGEMEALLGLIVDELMRDEGG